MCDKLGTVLDKPKQQSENKSCDEPKIVIRTLADLLGKSCETATSDNSCHVLYNNLLIPEYQRPYKWKTKNVDELNKDIKEFCKGSKKYRLGTVVLLEKSNNKYEIVDGQQRLVTLAMLLKSGGETKGLDRFLSDNSFSHNESQLNIRKNYEHIKGDKMEINENLFPLIEFVVVIINEKNIDEAFQFFDSQNSRGKKLEAYDYLKAHHIHEMKNQFSHIDEENLKFWEEFDKNKLKQIFDMLYRIMRWNKNESAWELDKEHRKLFYGVSEQTLTYPCHTSDSIIYNLWKHGNNSNPYQINNIFVEGGMFFDVIKYFATLYRRLIEQEYGSNELRKTAAWKAVYDDYQGKWRIGDQYVRSLFFAMLLQYINKFGEANLEKHFSKMLYFAYRIRLEYARVWWNRIEERARAADGLFQIIRRASTPEELDDYIIEKIQWQYMPTGGAWKEIISNWASNLNTQN